MLMHMARQAPARARTGLEHDIVGADDLDRDLREHAGRVGLAAAVARAQHGGEDALAVRGKHLVARVHQLPHLPARAASDAPSRSCW